MNDMLILMRDTALLREPAMEAFRDRKDAMKRGVAILLACFLIAGSLAGLISLVNHVRPFGPEQADRIRQEVLQGFEQFQFYGAMDPDAQAFLDQFTQNFESGLRMGVEIASLPTVLPKGIAGFFTALGGWLTTAFGRLTAFLAYGIWVLLFAKLMGGSGGVDRFFGLTALFAVPNLLSFFAPIPCVGPMIAFVGWVWGVVVYIKAVQVSQRFTAGRAVVAALLPAVILILLAVILSVLAMIGLIAVVSPLIGN
ncbi:MAG: YIP1 family protein [Anaerolineae bacterium]|nr:YIP1 family protein [Anaerolineae bacterium]